jgi:hypothetical protein
MPPSAPSENKFIRYCNHEYPIDIFPPITVHTHKHMTCQSWKNYMCAPGDSAILPKDNKNKER